MRDAETVLAIIRERGTRGLPLEDVYRMLFNSDLYLRAYGRLYKNEGAMTKGTSDETVDGMSLAKIEKLIDDVRHERHRWTPVRRVHIPKKKGGQRPLGLPTWKDKLLQEVLRSILEAYYPRGAQRDCCKQLSFQKGTPLRLSPQSFGGAESKVSVLDLPS
ncbi:hypothetical protein KSC_000170 [Ktedonobacter sp. SOSP1-52]|nr:hypothetical protein [Ktedonobacter sp. SOSP1-52]GHO61125.1 hypothetical protein KSC_000170 [Ktedonobacter sp. SOSP1-52]